MEIIIENFALFERILASTTLDLTTLSLTNPPNRVEVFIHLVVLINSVYLLLIYSVISNSISFVNNFFEDFSKK